MDCASAMKSLDKIMVGWLVSCLLTGPGLWKRMLLKCSITIVFTCPRESVRYLGVTLQGGLKIDDHVTETANKVKTDLEDMDVDTRQLTTSSCTRCSSRASVHTQRMAGQEDSGNVIRDSC